MVIPGLHIDPNADVPVYRQIADGVRAAARDGRLEPGGKLPPTRDLARQLGVNRNTVVAAYDELADEGWVRSHTGRGTFLSAPPDDAEVEPREASRSAPLPPAGWTTTFSRAVEGSAMGSLQTVYQAILTADGISFAGSYPAGDLMPVEAFRHALDVTLRRGGADVLGYGPIAGHMPLREWIAREMSAGGSAVRPEDVLVTNGAQQAIDLVMHTFVERGDAVVIEEPTYSGALSVLGSLGARVVGVSVDELGVRPDLLAIALARHRPRLIYVQPTLHNPTAAVMSEARRRDVLELAARYRCVVMEDDWAGGLLYGRPAPPTLHALDAGQNVIHLSTFSKKLMPGLRVGWIVAPERVRQRLVALKQIRDCGTSPLVQAALHAFLEQGGLAAHLERALPVYRARCDRMIAALDRHFPEGATWSRPAGGLFLWVTLPGRIDAGELFDAARREGVSFSRGDMFHVGGGGRSSLRLTFSAAGEEEIDGGIATLGRLIEERLAGRASEGLREAVETMPML